MPVRAGVPRSANMSSRAETRPEFGVSDFQREFSVSRETLVRLETLVGFLRSQNSIHNLVSARSLEHVWRRHVLDSAQLDLLIPPEAKTLADLGSGAGFPGLVLAALRPGALRVSLYEATGKKCRFLREAAERMGIAAEVCNCRIEDAPPRRYDVVTARACAPVPTLLTYAQKFIGPDTICLFNKGQNVGSELTDARNSWRVKAQWHASLSDHSGNVLELREVVRLD